MTKKKGISVLLAILSFIFAIGIGYVYFLFFKPNVLTGDEKFTYLYVYDSDTKKDVFDQLKQQSTVKHPSSLLQVASLLKYEKIRSGRYKVENKMNNFELIRMLKNGNQTPLQLKINNIRTKENLAAKLSQQLMADSLEFISLLSDSAYQATFGLNPETALTLFLPNSYEVYWNIQPEKLFDRMAKEYQKFWNEERRKKAAAIPLSVTEVGILASIVDAESNASNEKPIIAGLYINRLEKGIPLQADPTVIFAANDFTIRRVLNVHTKIDSPYNTYKYKGLPPGPIRIASIDGIDAVLNYKKHNYIFMCAKETLNGEHNFAVTWQEHLQNARKYQNALNERGIKK
jgi:UPF0755 protein